MTFEQNPWLLAPFVALICIAYDGAKWVFYRGLPRFREWILADR